MIVKIYKGQEFIKRFVCFNREAARKECRQVELEYNLTKYSISYKVVSYV